MRYLIFIAALWLPLSATAAVTLDSIKSSRTAGYAPLAIHFDAFDPLDDSTMSEGEEFRSVIYSWNFGDCSSNNEYWEFSDRPKCLDQGPITGHVFDPGRYGETFDEICAGSIPCARYTVGVTASDRSGALVGQASQTIEVYDPNHLETWCIIDTSDNDLGAAGESTEDYAGCPNTACTSNPNDPHCVDSPDGDWSYENHAGANTRLLYRRGDAWLLSGGITPNTGPGLVAAFGSGPDPIWRSDGSLNSKRLLSASGGNDVRITQLDFDCNHDPDVNGSTGLGHQCVGSHNASTGSHADDLLLYRLDLTNYYRGINLEIGSSAVTWPRNQAVVEVSLDEQISPSGRLASGICSNYSGASNRIHGIGPMWIGNEIADAKITEQNLRHMWFSRLVVNHNRFDGAAKSLCGNDDGRSTVDIRSCKSNQGGQKCVDANQTSEYYYFTGNYVEPSTTKQVISIQSPATPNVSGEHITINDVLIDANYIVLGRESYATNNGNGAGCVALYAGSDLTDSSNSAEFNRTTFRNNIVDAQQGDFSTERCGPTTWLAMSRSSARDTIAEHNSIWVDRPSLIGTCSNNCKPIGVSDADVCRNNVLYAPGVAASAKSVCATDTDSSSNPFLAAAGASPAERFKLKSGAAPIDAAAGGGWPVDYALNCRDDGVADDGAWEFGGTACQPAPAPPPDPDPPPAAPLPPVLLP